jgi:hypothetical protein
MMKRAENKKGCVFQHPSVDSHLVLSDPAGTKTFNVKLATVNGLCLYGSVVVQLDKPKNILF